ncbi:MAG TPA: glutathione S-transferase family protein [Myxococcota bacterium]|jgi:glutathione S-transferase|nr:glutathione S-transferase family protein [Myxococcota bacterium]
MKLYNSLGPNPRLVRMFMLEKGISVPTEEIDIIGGENRRAPYTEKNPAGQMPCIALDDGRILSETIAICEYLEEKHPKPALVGSTPEERAETRMWLRRIELGITENLYNGFRFAEGKPMFESRLKVIPQAADDLKATARERLAWLDEQRKGAQWICGDRFSLADIALFVALEFGATVGQPTDPKLPWVNEWLKRVAARPSAQASLHPKAVAAGMKG